MHSRNWIRKVRPTISTRHSFFFSFADSDEAPVRKITSTLSRIHIVPAEHVPRLADSTDDGFKRVREEIAGLVNIVKDYPYYKYNGLWTRDLQNTVGSLIGGVFVREGVLIVGRGLVDVPGSAAWVAEEELRDCGCGE